MLRKNFPGRKNIRRAEAIERNQKHLNMLEISLKREQNDGVLDKKRIEYLSDKIDRSRSHIEDTKINMSTF